MCRLQSPMMDFNKNFHILLNMTQGALKNLFAHNEIASWKALCASTQTANDIGKLQQTFAAEEPE